MDPIAVGFAAIELWRSAIAAVLARVDRAAAGAPADVAFRIAALRVGAGANGGIGAGNDVALDVPGAGTAHRTATTIFVLLTSVADHPTAAGDLTDVTAGGRLDAQTAAAIRATATSLPVDAAATRAGSFEIGARARERTGRLGADAGTAIV